LNHAARHLRRDVGLLYLTVAVVWMLSGRVSSAGPLRLVNDGYLGPSADVAVDKVPGFGVEVVRQVLAGLGEDVSFELVPTKRAALMVMRGERDGILAALRDADTERFCSFPDEPLVYDRWVLFVRTIDLGKLKFRSTDDIAGHDIAVHEPAPGVFEQQSVSPDI
jgi:polar amino acid transport system substrate-binding protein